MSKERKVYLLPLVLMLGYILLIIHSHAYDTGLAQFSWFPDQSAGQIDFFLYYKMIGIVVLGIVISCILLYDYAKHKKIVWSTKWYFILCYGILVLLSGLFSEYRYWAFHGSYEMFESVPVVISYVLVCYFAYAGLQSEEEVGYVLKIAGIGMLLLMLIGMFQFFGLDIFRTSIGKRMILNPSMWDQLDTIGFTFPLGTSYSTLYNTNYFSFYFGCITPVLLLLLLYEKKLQKKLILLGMSVMCIINMIGSNSKTGIAVLFVVAVIGGVLYFTQIKKHYWILLFLLLVLGVLLGTYSIRYGSFSNLLHAFTGDIEFYQEDRIVDKIDTNDENVVFYLGEHEVRVSYYILDENIYIFLEDENGEEYNYSYTGKNDMTWKLEDDRLPEFLVTPVYIDDKVAISVTVDGHEWHFSNQIDDTYYYYNGAAKYDKIEPIEKSSLFNDNIMSGRGDLWNRLLPRLKQCILLGEGSNNFMFVYPQNDYIAKKYHNTETLFDVKAHNMYFQQFAENGMLALMAFLIFYLFYFIESFVMYFKSNKDSYLQTVGVGIFLGTIAYMIAGIANDSNVNTAPVFWSLLGIGLAVNRMNKKTSTKEE